VFLLVFSVVVPDSLQSCLARWGPELNENCPNASIILVGLQTELRDHGGTLESLSSKKQTPVTYQQGSEVASKIHAVLYMEASVVTKEGVKEAFEAAMRVVINPPKKKKDKKDKRK